MRQLREVITSHATGHYHHLASEVEEKTRQNKTNKQKLKHVLGFACYEEDWEFRYRLLVAGKTLPHIFIHISIHIDEICT